MQYIALNSTGAAEGLLYVDDGTSFEYQKGAYILRSFVFKNGRLECLNALPKGGARRALLLVTRS